MHLKNFSLLEKKDKVMGLSPAYDLLCTELLMPDYPEELAFTINVRHSIISRRDFDFTAARLGINDKVRDLTYQRFSE